MALIYRVEEAKKKVAAFVFAADGGKGRDLQRLIFLVALVAILLTATSRLVNIVKSSLVGAEIPTPALVVNDKVKPSGKFPRVEKVKKCIGSAKKPFNFFALFLW